VLTFNTINEYKIENIDGIEVVRLPSVFRKDPIRFSLLYRKKFKKLANKAKKVIFHFPSGQPELYLRTIEKIPAEKICFYHSDIVGGNPMKVLYNKIIVKKFLEKMDVIIATSPNIVESSLFLKDFKEKIKIIPLFVDTEHFYPRNKNKREYLLSKFGRNINNIVLYIGRLGRYKGLDYLIRAMSYVDNNIGLVIIGKGPKEQELKKLVKHLDLQDKVLFHDHVSYSELPEYYSSADVFVLPSIDRGEAFGLVALEAMACGVPVITTELGTGTSYHNIDNTTGKIVKPKDFKELTQAIQYICRNRYQFDPRKIRQRAEEFSLLKFKENIHLLLEGNL